MNRQNQTVEPLIAGQLTGATAISFLPIRAYHARRAWSERNSNYTCMALYNTGHQLHINPYNLPATTYYNHVWPWIGYHDLREPGNICISDKKFAGLLSDLVKFQHCGHRHDRCAEVRVGATWSNAPVEAPIKRFDIPVQCILYLAVRWGHVRDSLLVYQPLPRKLFPLRATIRCLPVPTEYLRVNE